MDCFVCSSKCAADVAECAYLAQYFGEIVTESSIIAAMCDCGMHNNHYIYIIYQSGEKQQKKKHFLLKSQRISL